MISRFWLREQKAKTENTNIQCEIDFDALLFSSCTMKGCFWLCAAVCAAPTAQGNPCGHLYSRQLKKTKKKQNNTQV